MNIIIEKDKQKIIIKKINKKKTLKMKILQIMIIIIEKAIYK